MELNDKSTEWAIFFKNIKSIRTTCKTLPNKKHFLIKKKNIHTMYEGG